jgi:hypothetical protein
MDHIATAASPLYHGPSIRSCLSTRIIPMAVGVNFVCTADFS